MTPIGVILTGGTVGQRTDAGVAVPDADSTLTLVETCRPPNVSVRVLQAMRRNSPDITPGDWSQLALAVNECLEEGVQGVVILHGTDTMHYTAAALSFALAGTAVPIVLTGSMSPGNDQNSDALSNLRSAFAVVAQSDLAEVCVVFSSTEQDTIADIIRGNRAMKQRTSAADAFRSVGLSRLGSVTPQRVSLTPPARLRPPMPAATSLRPRFSGATDIVKITPMLTAPRLRALLEGLQGVVLEGTGAGHVHADHLEVIADFGRPTVLSTQVLYDAECLGMYASDRALTSLPNVIQGGGMTSATAVVKLSWALGQEFDAYEILPKDIAGELEDTFA